MPDRADPQPKSTVTPARAAGTSNATLRSHSASFLSPQGNGITARKLRAHVTSPSIPQSAPLPNPFSPDPAQRGDPASLAKMAAELKEFMPGADREALKTAMQVFGDERRSAGLAEIYAELYAPGVTDTDLLPAGERAGGDPRLEEKLIALAGGGKGDFAARLEQREAVAEWKLKHRYGLSLKRVQAAG